MRNEKTMKIVGLGLMTAVVVVLQLLGSFIHLGVFSITLVLAPIIVGAALYGILGGAWLGFVFGVMVLLTDASLFLAISVPGTVVTCLGKGILAGVVAGAVYLALQKSNKLFAVILAGIAAPVTNTGCFLIGCLLFFKSTIVEWAGGESLGRYLIFGLVGMNFIVELLINMILATVIVQIIGIAAKGLSTGSVAKAKT